MSKVFGIGDNRASIASISQVVLIEKDVVVGDEDTNKNIMHLTDELPRHRGVFVSRHLEEPLCATAMRCASPYSQNVGRLVH